ncbi:hypothetical protein ACFWPV_12475 [Streptomyces uncialis]|uniref:hypothetical protein n=1 Tax=Streptomyces uncialis TaxID=1048205 RepID=UPI00364D42D9
MDEPVRFHLFTGPLPSGRSAAAALRASGIAFTSLQPEVGDIPVEGLLAGECGLPLLAEALLALRNEVRHGLVVHPVGPDGLVIRNDSTVAQGLIMVQRGHRAAGTRDAAGLRHALSLTLAEAAETAVRPYAAPFAASVLFAGTQNTELAAEAARLTAVFADPDFVRRADPTGDLLADPRQVAEVNSGPRKLLDMLLLTHGMSPHGGMAAAAEIASKVEVFLQLSTAAEGRTLSQPLVDGGRGFCLGLPAITSEMMANLSWALPTLFSVVSGQEIRDQEQERARAWSEIDVCLASYLRSRRPRRSSAPLSPPQPLIPMSMPDGVSAYGSGDPFVVFNACNLFLLARELVPILSGGPSGDGPDASLPLFTADLPRDVRREVQADCAAYMITINALIVQSGREGPYVPDFDNIARHLRVGRTPFFGRTRHLRERARRDADLLTRCMHRTTEALLSYYAIAGIFAATARADGQSLLARQLEAVAERRETVCEYVLRIKREQLPQAWGFRTWDELEETHWQGVQEYVRHVQLDVVPGMARS